MTRPALPPPRVTTPLITIGRHPRLPDLAALYREAQRRSGTLPTARPGDALLSRRERELIDAPTTERERAVVRRVMGGE